MEYFTERYPYLIEETIEHVKNFSETKYNIMLNNKSIISYRENMTSIQLDEGMPCICK